MAKISNRFLALQFLIMLLSMQFFVAGIRSIIIGRDFFLILLPLLIALLFGSFIAHLCFRIFGQKINSEMIFTISTIILALCSSLLILPERSVGIQETFIVFRTILFVCFFTSMFVFYSTFVSIDRLKQYLDTEDYSDLVRSTFAGIFIGIIYNLVLRTAGLALNPYLIIFLSILLSILSVYRYNIKISYELNQDDEPIQEKLEHMKILPHILVFISVYVIFMLPLNNPELFSYLAGLNHEIMQYIFILASIIGILLGGKVIMMKLLKPRVYIILLSYLPLLTFISIGLFGLYLFYPPNHQIYVVNYVVAIFIISISGAVSFFEIFSISHHRKSAFFVLMLFLMQLMHNGIRILMIERHMPYIWTVLLIIAGICQIISYKQITKNESKSHRISSEELIDEVSKEEEILHE